MACAVIGGDRDGTPTAGGTAQEQIARIQRVRLSVIIRARDEEAAIGRCLDRLADQQLGELELETIVVDSGSRDRTVALARAAGARVIACEPERFSFGRALNLGAAAAGGELLVALSADAALPDERWLGRLVGHFEDGRVACASGERWGPDGLELGAVVRQDLELARRRPRWGYSNAAGGFRAEFWRQRPFAEELPGCEDAEWSQHWLVRGYVCVIDPRLSVEHDHTHDPLPSIYRRARREAEGFAMFLDTPPYGARELLRDWYSDLRFYDSPLRARVSHRRAARLLGEYAGRRRARRSA